MKDVLVRFSYISKVLVHNIFYGERKTFFHSLKAKKDKRDNHVTREKLATIPCRQTTKRLIRGECMIFIIIVSLRFEICVVPEII